MASGRPPMSLLPILGFLFAVAVGTVLVQTGKITIPNFSFSLGAEGAAPPAGPIPGNDDRERAKNYARQVLEAKGQGGQFDCLDKLWIGESGWNAWADNPHSSAYGIPQALESLHGHVYDLGDWKAQVDWGLAYIDGQYGSPCAAWAFWQRTDPRPHPGHWY